MLDEDGTTELELDEGRALLLVTTEVDEVFAMLELDEDKALLVGTTELVEALVVLQSVLLVRGAELRTKLEEGFADEVVTTLLVDEGAMVIVCVVYATVTGTLLVTVATCATE